MLTGFNFAMFHWSRRLRDQYSFEHNDSHL
nr:hypothetical protein [Tanacetum cinerariifolium]